MQCCSTDLSKISFKFTDKVSVFDDLSVSKTHFTDKQAFSSDLSVNFCPLWWRFTDKRSIFIDVSVILPNAAPAQSSLQVLSQIYRQTILGYFHHGNGKRHAYEKTGWFAIICKSSGFSIWDRVFSQPLFAFSDRLMFCSKKFSNRSCSRNSGFKNTIALHFIKKAGTPRPFNQKFQ